MLFQAFATENPWCHNTDFMWREWKRPDAAKIGESRERNTPPNVLLMLLADLGDKA
jgi:hypothetical protein